MTNPEDFVLSMTKTNDSQPVEVTSLPHVTNGSKNRKPQPTDTDGSKVFNHTPHESTFHKPSEPVPVDIVKALAVFDSIKSDDRKKAAFVVAAPASIKNALENSGRIDARGLNEAAMLQQQFAVRWFGPFDGGGYVVQGNPDGTTSTL